VSFNLYPGVSQIGQYVNGTPTDIVDLGGSGIDLHSGAIYDVTLNYDGSNINVTVTDDANPTTTFSTTFSAVNVPAVVRGTTAYVGFTGGTGAATSVQDILSWSYVDPPAPYRPPEPGAGGVPIPALVRKIRPWLEGTDWSYVDPPGPYRPPEPRAGGVPISAVVRQIRPWLEETERHSDIAISGPSRFTVAQRERVWRATPHPEADDDALPAAVPAAAATV
jgi:hypothetical protein